MEVDWFGLLFYCLPRCFVPVRMAKVQEKYFLFLAAISLTILLLKVERITYELHLPSKSFIRVGATFYCKCVLETIKLEIVLIFLHLPYYVFLRVSAKHLSIWWLDDG